MPRFNKWLFFFEEPSEKRDVRSWDAVLNKHLPKSKLNILGIVSDRAKALVKLGDSDYLAAFSMPDLFHFQQDIGKLCGLQIGRKHKKAQELLTTIDKGDKTSTEKEALQASSNKIAAVHKEYRHQTRQINKVVHPFDQNNNWADGERINKELLQSVTKVSRLAESIEINIDLSKASKVLHQIPDMVKGIDNWTSQMKQKMERWVQQNLITQTEKIWLSCFLLPFLYWHFQLKRTKNGRSNPELEAYYEQRMQGAKETALKQVEILGIGVERQNILFDMAHQMAGSFQRSSSQVEGRNGYLAFMHHGHKGIPPKRRKALTVIHNYDIKRVDGSTPAQRLFGKEFPDLFEFLCKNVTGFKEPRKRKAKPLKNSLLQR